MDKKIETLLKKDWYFQGFNGVPGVLYGPAWSMVRDMPKLLGFGYSVCVEYFCNDVCYYLYSWDDLHNIHDIFFKNYYKNKNYLIYLLKTDKKICKQVLKKYKELGKKNWKTASVKELFEGWREANRLYSYLLSVSHIIEGFSLTTEDRIRNLISEIFPNNSEALLLLTTPQDHSFMSVEHYQLCLIARKIKNAGLNKGNLNQIPLNRPIYNELHKHQKKYFWKLNGYTSAKYLNIEHFITEIQELFDKKANEDKFIEDFEKLPKKIVQKKKLLKKIKNRELLDLLTISDVMFKIHDRRKEYMTQSITYLELILNEIASRFDAHLSLLHYIRPSELESLPEILSELKKRREYSVFFTFPNDEEYVISGLKAKKYFSKVENRLNPKEMIEIKGNCACPGKVIGRVKICRGEKELAKMKDGNILVACMTQPEFIPAMKKASAVITDEGGLTCHAAIVSRELKIPCIIGTKHSTKILKDDDLVEVDANLGIIKKL